MTNPFDQNLEKRPANYQPLTPLSLLARAGHVWPEHTAIIHGDQRLTYAQFYARCRRLASALTKHGIGVGDTVSVMLPNTPPMGAIAQGTPGWNNCPRAAAVIVASSCAALLTSVSATASPAIAAWSTSVEKPAIRGRG